MCMICRHTRARVLLRIGAVTFNAPTEQHASTRSRLCKHAGHGRHKMAQPQGNAPIKRFPTKLLAQTYCSSFARYLL